jgi:hypothetical protein
MREQDLAEILFYGQLSVVKFSEMNVVVPVFGTCLRRVLGRLLF